MAAKVMGPKRTRRDLRKVRLRKALFVVALVACGTLVLRWFASAGLLETLLSRALTSAEKLSRIRTFFDSLGYAAPLAYVLIVTIEVVIAPLPGAMLYAPGGIVFGGFWGGVFSLLGNVAGAAIACQLMRIVGGGLRGRLLSMSSSDEVQKRIARHGIAVVFLLRVNPLTSSDLVSYAAGVTSMPVWKLCLGTALGMAPLCWVQAYSADRLLAAFPHLLSPLLGLCAVYAIAVLGVMWRLASAARVPPAVASDAVGRG